MRILRTAGLIALLLAGGASFPRSATIGRDLDREIERRGLARNGVRLGIQVAVAGRGVVYSRDADVLRAAASAVKSAVLVDLLALHGTHLEDVPSGVDALLSTGTHPAFAGFTPVQLAACRRALGGRTYRELARIMMGRTPATNEAYNAACNVLMVKLGGPEAISRRLAGLDPAFRGFSITRYMQHWNGEGDNRASPAALVALYRMAASASVPGLSAGAGDLLRELLLQEGDGGPGSVYEKDGTLYPRPMVRVHAGYQVRPDGDLFYAIMGEVPEPSPLDPAGSFLELMDGVDALAGACRGPLPARRP